MRADKIKEMMTGRWRAFICGTDTWHIVTDGVELSQAMVGSNNWAAFPVEDLIY